MCRIDHHRTIGYTRCRDGQVAASGAMGDGEHDRHIQWRSTGAACSSPTLAGNRDVRDQRAIQQARVLEERHDRMVSRDVRVDYGHLCTECQEPSE